MRHRGRIDKTQAEIVSALRSVGASVHSLADVGKGVPDLLVGFRNVTLLFEVKGIASIKRHPPDGLLPDQRAWHAKWSGSRVHIVHDTTDALEALGVI